MPALRSPGELIPLLCALFPLARFCLVYVGKSQCAKERVKKKGSLGLQVTSFLGHGCYSGTEAAKGHL